MNNEIGIFFHKLRKNIKIKNYFIKAFALILVFCCCLTANSVYAQSQFSIKHYLPPVWTGAPSNVSTYKGNLQLVVSTCITHNVNIRIKKSDGTILATSTCVSGSPYVYTLGTNYSNTTPGNVWLPANTFTVASDRGLIIEADDPVFVNLREVSASANRWSVSSKGDIAKGKAFRTGHMFDNKNSNAQNCSNVISVMAIKNNTTVKFDIKNDGSVTLGNGSQADFSITLNAGQSYVVRASIVGVGQNENLNGTLVTSNNDIVVISGTYNAGYQYNSTPLSDDDGYDEIIPINQTGSDYAVQYGKTNSTYYNAENANVVAIYNKTAVFANGAYKGTINAGSNLRVTFPTRTAGTPMRIQLRDNSAGNAASSSVDALSPIDGYVYQDAGGAIGERGMSIIPALTCTGTLYSEFLSLGPNANISIVATTGAVVKMNGSTISPISGYSNVAIGPNNYDFYSRTAPSLGSKVNIASTKTMHVGMMYGDNSTGAFAFFSNFSTAPVLAHVPCPNTGVVLIGMYEKVRWYYNGNLLVERTPINSAGDTLWTKLPGYYSAIGYTQNCDWSDTSTIFLSGCGTDLEVNKLISSKTVTANYHDVTYKVVVKNIGVSAAYYLQLRDTIIKPSCMSVSVVSPPVKSSKGELVPPAYYSSIPASKTNVNFSPGVDDLLLTGYDSLAVGAVDTITYTLRYTPSNELCLGEILNRVYFTSSEDNIPNNGTGYFVATDTSDYVSYKIQKSPGGVIDNLLLWVRADKNVTESGSVSSWNDYVTSYSNAGNGSLAYNNNSHNFNPGITFDGDNDWFTMSSSYDFSNFTNGGTYFVMATPKNGGTRRFWQLGGSSNQGGDGGMLFTINSGPTIGLEHNYNSSPTPPTASYLKETEPFTLNVDNIFSAKYNGNGNFWTTATDKALHINGKSLTLGTGTNNNLTTPYNHTRPYRRIGARPDGAFDYAGDMSEIIIYNDDLSETDLLKVNSYLAIKYGVTLSDDNNGNGAKNELIATGIYEGDYLASDNTVVWESKLNTAYDNDIFGIGCDNIEALDQRISKSINETTVLTVALDKNFTAANINHTIRTTAFANDLQYLTLGSNDAEIIFDQTTELPIGYDKRMAREWLVQKTSNFTQSVWMQFDNCKSTVDSTYYLIIDTDNDGGDFTDATTVVSLDADGITTSAVNLPDGTYITVLLEVAQQPVKDATLNSVQENGSLGNPVSVLYSEEITYNLSAKNSRDIAGTMVLSDTLPPYLKYVTGSASPTTGFSLTSYAGSPVQDVVTWTFTSVPSLSSVTASYNATPESGSCATQPLFVNTVSATVKDNLKLQSSATYHQGAGVATVTFSAMLHGNIYNAEKQAVDFNTEARSGILVVPDEGYEFTGWSHDEYISLRGKEIPAEENVMNYDTLTIYGDVELRANFDIANYTVNYYLNGASEVNNPTTYTINTETFTLINPMKEDDTFIGWTTGKEGETPQMKVFVPEGSTGDLTYFANFLKSGSEVGNENVEVGNNIWASGNTLYVRTTSAGSVIRVYNTEGVLCKQQTVVSEGTLSMRLSQGIYIVTINNNETGKKVRID